MTGDFWRVLRLLKHTCTRNAAPCYHFLLLPALLTVSPSAVCTLLLPLYIPLSCPSPPQVKQFYTAPTASRSLNNCLSRS